MPKPAMSSASAAVAPGGGGQRRDNILDSQAAAGLAGGKQREGEQQQRLAQNREGHVDAARPLRRGRVAIGDENVGRDADERIDEIECEEIGGDEDAETAGHREEPRDREAPAWPALGASKSGRAGDDPQDRREREQQRARQIEPEAQAQCRRLEPERASRDGEDCSDQRGNRREPLKRQGLASQALREAGRQKEQREGQRGREQPGAEDGRGAGHGSAVAAARPIWRKSKNDCGANPSASATIASARAIASRLRCGGFSRTIARSESAGARMRYT